MPNYAVRTVNISLGHLGGLELFLSRQLPNWFLSLSNKPLKVPVVYFLHIFTQPTGTVYTTRGLEPCTVVAVGPSSRRDQENMVTVQMMVFFWCF